MEPLELFHSFLTRFVPLSTDEFHSIIVPRIEVRNYKKKSVVLPAGEVDDYINFVGKGLLRKYFRKQENEVITHITREGQIIHSQESFYSRTPSDYVIETIEPSTLLSINAKNLEAIFQTNASMERMGRLVITYIMIRSERWQMSLLQLTPRERFLQFVQNNSELMQRVPQKYLASLLNIQPETFSRFKHLLKGASAPLEKSE